MSTIKQKMLDKAGQIIAGLIYDIHIATGGHAEGFDMKDWQCIEDQLYELKAYVKVRDDIKNGRRIDNGIRETLIDQIMKDEE